MVCSFLWLSLEIKMFWKVMDKDISHKNPSLYWTTGEGQSVLTQVQSLMAPSTVDSCGKCVPYIVTGGVLWGHLSLLGGNQCGMQSVVIPPSLCSAAVGVGSPAHRPNPFSKAFLPRDLHVSSSLESLTAVWRMLVWKAFLWIRGSLRIGEGRPSPCQLTLPASRRSSPHHRASRLEEGAKWVIERLLDSLGDQRCPHGLSKTRGSWC